MLRRGGDVVKLLSSDDLAPQWPISAILNPDPRRHCGKYPVSAAGELYNGRMRESRVRNGLVMPVLARTAAVALVGALAACAKQGPLPGQSDVPPPGSEEAETGYCKLAVSEGATLLASREEGWGVVLPGDAWVLDCSNPERVSAKLTSNLGESLLFTVTQAAGMPDGEREHLDAIHARAKRVLPEAGAQMKDPRFVVARASPKTDEKTVFIYEVKADAFERQNMVSYHGWSVVKNDRGTVFECHLNATSKKRLDWPDLVAKVLSSCIALPR
jgi:hypothetical protein